MKLLINALGITALTAYFVVAVLSYAHAPALWPPAFSTNATAFFSQLYGQENLNAIRAFFGGPLAVIVVRSIPLIVASLAAITLVFLLNRSDHGRDNDVARRLLAWSFAFAFVSFFAYPVFTQDFWLSAVWGDMIASGVNPYYQKFTPELIGALPLDHFPMTMSYGPLWALISGAVMAVAGGSLLLAALLFKAILLAAWCAVLWLTDRIMLATAPKNRALALVIVGWLPLGVEQTVAEGHNDVMLVLPALLWIALLLQKKSAAPLALAASTLCKYTTAPLFVLDFINSIRTHRQTPSSYVLRMALPVLFGLAVLAIFYRSFAFFDGVLLVGSWHFMQPADAFMAFAPLAGNWIEPLSHIFTAVFPIIALYQCAEYWKKPDTENMLRSAVAIMCAVSFSLISHVWSWYLVWTLPLAALVPRWWLSRFIIGLALFTPFTVAVWWVPEVEGYQNLAALMMYSAAIVWAYATAGRDAGEPRRASGEVRQVDFSRAKKRSAAAFQVVTRRFEEDYEAETRLRARASGEN